MPVFKVFLKVAKRRIPSIILYVVIFACLGFFMMKNAASETEFTAAKPTIFIRDLDGSGASGELAEYLSEICQPETTLPDDDEVLQDALYYHTLNYVLIIEEGFEEKLSEGSTEGLFKSKSTEGMYSAYINMQLEKYMTAVRMYIAAGEPPQQACAKAAASESVEVDIVNESGANENIGYYARYLSYLFICILISGICPILMQVNSLRQRMDCSSLTQRSRTAQLFGGTAVCVLAVWLVFMALGAVYFGDSFFGRTGGYIMINSFALIIATAGLVLFISQFDLSSEKLSMVSNTLGLGMSFLCGTFVPQEMLGEGVLRVARFFPVYWYTYAGDILCGMSSESFTNEKFFGCVAVELLFAALFFAASVVVSREKRS